MYLKNLEYIPLMKVSPGSVVCLPMVNTLIYGLIGTVTSDAGATKNQFVVLDQTKLALFNGYSLMDLNSLGNAYQIHDAVFVPNFTSASIFSTKEPNFILAMHGKDIYFQLKHGMFDYMFHTVTGIDPSKKVTGAGYFASWAVEAETTDGSRVKLVERL